MKIADFKKSTGAQTKAREFGKWQEKKGKGREREKGRMCQLLHKINKLTDT